jgi:hypothetical protein
MSDAALKISAGPAALGHIRREGFDRNAFTVMAGASGGPKWLVLSQLDRVLGPWLLHGRDTPVFLLGSSIGAWRFACYAQSDPVAALDRFEDAYVAQRYDARPAAEEVTARSREILDILLSDHGIDEILTADTVRLNVMTVRSRALTASDAKVPLMTGLAVSALANAVSRKLLGLFYVRSLFSDPRSEPPFAELPGLPLERAPLMPANLREAILATGSIPLVLEGVRDIAGAARGTYRDGGIVDYHFDVELSGGTGLVLYPHFYGYVVPGWFDKSLKHRRGRANLDRVVLIHPSGEFVAGLPNGKIPDRKDFETMSNDARIRCWRRVIAECERLAETFDEWRARGQLEARVEPL